MTDPVHERVLRDLYPPEETPGLMPHLDLLIGMRLHLVIFAGMAEVPFLPLPCVGKVFGFARAADAPSCGMCSGRRPGCCCRRSTGCGTSGRSAWTGP